MGSVTEYLSLRQQTQETSGLPNYMVLPNWLGALQEKGQYRRPGQYGGWLGPAYDPLNTDIQKKDLKDNPYWRDCSDDELKFEIQGLVKQQQLSLNRLGNRKSLLEQFETQHRGLDSKRASTFDHFQQKALDLVTSKRTREALDITLEADKQRDAYGRHLYGQSCLMARRLVEAGVRFVTVHYDCVDGYSWDSHRSSNHLKNHLILTFDRAYSALITDLDEHGLLDETLVVAIGEMGRTPKANDNWGRGHWSTLLPAVLAGAGVRGGIVYGETDKNAEYPIEKPTSPEDVVATIYKTLGIDPEIRLPDAQGRPVDIVQGGTPVDDIFS